MSSINGNTSTFSFTIIVHFIYFSCLIVQARTTSIMLNRIDKSRYSCLFPDCKGKNIQSFIVKYDGSFEFFKDWGCFLLFLSLLSVFIMRGYWNLSYAFSLSIQVIMWVLAFILWILYIIFNWFLYVKPTLDSWFKFYLVMMSSAFLGC